MLYAKCIAFCIISLLLHVKGDFLSDCNGKSMTLKDCYKNSIEGFKLVMEKGIPARNIPVLDPFSIGKPAPRENAIRGIKYTIDLHNTSVENGSNYFVEEISSNPDNIAVTLKYPTLTWKMAGTIKALRINLEGGVIVRTSNNVVTFDLTKDDAPQMHMTLNYDESDTTVDIKNMNGRITKRYVEIHKDAVAKELIQDCIPIIETRVMNLLQEVVSPLNQLYPPPEV